VPYALVAAIVAVAAALFIAIAFRMLRRGHERGAALLVVLAALALRALAASDAFLHEWDERYHALVAKNLRDHPAVPTLYEDPPLPYDARDWMRNHVWLHKQPLALWLMAGSMSLFGVTEWAARLPSVLLAGLAVWLTFLIGRRVGGARVGLLAAALHAANGFLVDLAAGRASTDHVDATFLVLIEVAAWLAVRGGRRWAWTALGIGAAIGLSGLAKSPIGALVVVAWAPIVWKEHGAWRTLASGAIAAAAAVAVFLPWQLWIHSEFPTEASYEAVETLAHLTRVFHGHEGGPHYHLALFLRYFGEVSILGVAWFGWHAWRTRDPRALGIFLWWLVTYAFFSAVATKMPAYPMGAAPAAVVMVAAAWWWLRDRVGAAVGWRKAAGAVVLAAAVLLPVRYTLERLHIFGGWEPRPAWAEAYRRAGMTLDGKGRRVVVFGVARPIELMFYAPVTAYRRTPTPADLATLRERGFEVVQLGEEGR
jgi:4-amino-4-deoxy-L-arabinose transferase